MQARTNRAVLLIAGLLIAGSSLAAQSRTDWRAEVLGSVMAYRMSVLGDATVKFDGCSLARALEVEPEQVAASLSEAVRSMVGPCPAAGDRSARMAVLVDSLSSNQNGEGRAYLTVIRGEWVHREDYLLVPGPRAAVREVRVWGALQSYPRRPSRD